MSGALLDVIFVEMGFKALRILVSICVIYSCYLSVAAVHEAGHWIAAKACGFHLLEFRVGPFQWQSGSGWKISFRRRFLLTGHIIYLPTGYDRALRFRRIAVTLAGPSANLVLGLCGAYVYHLMPIGDASGIVALTSVGSLFVCGINLIPMSKGTSRTDGLRLIDTFSPQRFRNFRFMAHYMDAKDEINQLVKANELARAKDLVESVLSLAADIPDSSGLVKALQDVLEWISQAQVTPK